MGIEALLLSQVITISGSTGQVVTKQADGSLALQDAAGGALSGTGSVDNAVLRADGTGGATLQNSAFVIADNATASPNNTVNHASIQATGGTTNVSVSIVPKGTGAFSLQVPDGTSAGGNARGANAVDLQTARDTAAKVASGGNSFVGGGARNAASNVYAAVVGGFGNLSNSSYGFIGGGISNVNGGAASCIVGGGWSDPGLDQLASANFTAIGGGAGNYATAAIAFIPGGIEGLADRVNMTAHGNAKFSARGDNQWVRFLLQVKTTNATPTTMLLYSPNRLTIPAGKVFAFTARITGIKSDGTAVAEYLRKGVIKRIVNTTSLVGSIETIGTDIEDNASTDVAITADDTNEALQINVTGIASETWRWAAVVEGVEIAYGT
jgi:hypothetical protein